MLTLKCCAYYHTSVKEWEDSRHHICGMSKLRPRFTRTMEKITRLPQVSVPRFANPARTLPRGNWIAILHQERRAASPTKARELCIRAGPFLKASPMARRVASGVHANRTLASASDPRPESCAVHAEGWQQLRVRAANDGRAGIEGQYLPHTAAAWTRPRSTLPSSVRRCWPVSVRARCRVGPSHSGAACIDVGVLAQPALALALTLALSALASNCHRSSPAPARPRFPPRPDHHRSDSPVRNTRDSLPDSTAHKKQDSAAHGNRSMSV